MKIVISGFKDEQVALLFQDWFKNEGEGLFEESVEGLFIAGVIAKAQPRLDITTTKDDKEMTTVPKALRDFLEEAKDANLQFLSLGGHYESLVKLQEILNSKECEELFKEPLVELCKLKYEVGDILEFYDPEFKSQLFFEVRANGKYGRHLFRLGEEGHVLRLGDARKGNYWRFHKEFNERTVREQTDFLIDAAAQNGVNYIPSIRIQAYTMLVKKVLEA